MMGITRFIRWAKTHWLALIAVLSLVLNVYFFALGRQSREPVFIADEVRWTLFDAAASRDTHAFQVVDSASGVVIQKDITLVRFYFWNAGRLPIRAEHVLEPIRLRVSDPNARILDARVVKRSRPVVAEGPEPMLSRNPDGSLQLDFRILEQEDGVAGQVIFAGSPRATLEVSGTIEGVSEFLGGPTGESAPPSYVLKAIGLGIAYFALWAGAFGLVLVGMASRDEEKKLLERLASADPESEASIQVRLNQLRSRQKRALIGSLVLMATLLAVAVVGKGYQPLDPGVITLPASLRG